MDYLEMTIHTVDYGPSEWNDNYGNELTIQLPVHMVSPEYLMNILNNINSVKFKACSFAISKHIGTIVSKCEEYKLFGPILTDYPYVINLESGYMVKKIVLMG